MKEISKRYNPSEIEPKWREFWEKNGIYKFNPKKKGKVFSVDTPPPYVSAEHLHAGHVMSYAQAEFVVRFKRMQGYNVFYPMGFDDNGLPTERYVEKKYKINKSKITRSEFIKLCLEETEKGAKNYKDLWTLLGISVDWSKTYSTINDHCRKISQWSFLDLYKKNLVYKAKKPILWCTTCQTAIAQADLEAEEKESNLVYIKAKAETGEEIVFSTTRPELLPAVMGISAHPDDKRYKKLIGKKIIMPLTKKAVTLTPDEATDMKYGSGAVYYCSYGGGECIEWLSRHPEADPTELVLSNGRFSAVGGKYEGMKVLEVRKQIVKDLQEAGAVQKIEPIKHSVYTHERCGTDVEYIESEQWFIRLLDKKKEFLKRGSELKWYPASMKKIYDSWVKNLKWDWCISRQRYYGVPFPVWYCEKCGGVILPEEKDLPVDPMEEKPKIKSCPKCGSKKFVPEMDVLDTWQTSSLTPVIGSKLVSEKNVEKKLYPNTLRPQAHEIIRTWLFYTIVKSHYHHGSLPFRDAMISGHGLDDQGRKISKRLGNYIPPQKIIDEYGADAVRYWATGAMLGQNLRFSLDEIKIGRKTTTKLWNAARFMGMNVEKAELLKSVDVLELADAWIVGELNKTIVEVTAAFEKYEYARAKESIDKFFWSKFADYYVEMVKYRFFGDDEKSKKIAGKTLATVFFNIVKLYAPIMPFVTEEIFHSHFKNLESAKSIHLSQWPNEIKLPAPKGRGLASGGKKTADISDFPTVLKAIEEIRKFKTKKGLSLGAEVESLKLKTKVNLKKYGELLRKVGRVGKIS
ncbi:MAG: valine--tRNA ligase [Candidatus Moranbacteria bacterium]|nr:valine--tRNA ligase [Candidatus Moranbacteria bacterium]